MRYVLTGNNQVRETGEDRDVAVRHAPVWRAWRSKYVVSDSQ
jgi:hypothetical protein